MEAARVSTISETPFVVGINLFMERNLKKIATHKPSHLVILPHFSLVLFVEIFIVLQNDVWIFFYKFLFWPLLGVKWFII